MRWMMFSSFKRLCKLEIDYLLARRAYESLSLMVAGHLEPNSRGAG